MSAISCYVPMCNNEIWISCSCTSPPTYSCKKHYILHFDSNEKSHNLTKMLSKPIEGTKEAILNFLTEQMLKNDEIKRKALASFNQTIYNLKILFKEILKEINSDSRKIAICLGKLLKIKKLSKLENDHILNLLMLQPYEAIEKAKTIFKNNNAELFNNIISQIDKIIFTFNKESITAIRNEQFINLESMELKLDLALSENNETIRADPKNYDSSYNEIGNKIRSEETLKYLSDTIVINANSTEYHSNKGRALRKLGKREEAMDCFKEAIRIDPNNSYVYNEIGLIFYNEKRYEEAIEYYNDRIRANSKFSAYYRNKGRALRELSRIEEAMECFLEAIRIDPNNAYSYNEIGVILDSKNNYDEAIKYYSTAIRINPNNAIYCANKGCTLSDIGRREEAMKYLQESIRINPNLAYVYAKIGYILYGEKRYEEAIKYYNDAIRINPNETVFFLNKARALKELEKEKKQ